MSPVLSSADLRVGAAPVLSVNRGSAPIWTPGGPGGLPEIGDPFEGGFFAGLISHTADGNPTHALIVAPVEGGIGGSGVPANSYPTLPNPIWKTSNTLTTGAVHEFDGAVNTAAIVAAGIADHPAAQFMVNLSIGGFTDWYLPARLELDIAFKNCKPTTVNNSPSFGINPYSVPARTIRHTATDPSQTSIAIFQAGGAQRFLATFHWSSTQTTDSAAWSVSIGNGSQANRTKTDTITRARAFRKVTL